MLLERLHQRDPYSRGMLLYQRQVELRRYGAGMTLMPNQHLESVSLHFQGEVAGSFQTLHPVMQMMLDQ
jgi:hypothetical protein